MKQPTFTHAELIQLWHAISNYVAEIDTSDPGLGGAAAFEALSKLDDYVLEVTSK